ncbi:hypothetical protein N9R08_02545 [Flavobacteriaceae bacterium]|nr:hypothetical protein [Flavobacteriaceae bacterium]
MENIIIITQARIGSTRLPSKVLKEIEGKSLLQIHLERLKKSKYGNNIIVATTFEDGVEKIIKIAKSVEVDYYQGDTNDVLDRFYNAAKGKSPDYIVRVTSDCPLLDPVLMDEIIATAINNKKDYTSNVLSHDFPDGQDIEVFRFKALEKAWQKSLKKEDREHVTKFIIDNSSYFQQDMFSSEDIVSNKNYGDIRMTLDYIEDFECLFNLILKLGINQTWQTYTNYIIENPEEFRNQKITRNIKK